MVGVILTVIALGRFAKNIERIGDHVTNICETIYYMVEGERMQQQRIRQTKSDRLLTDSITEK